jgi:nicotinamidase/pyrazinamidase
MRLRRGAPPGDRVGCGTLAAVKERYGPTTALIVVDVQNDFADPKGALYVEGAADVVRMASSEARLAAEKGAFVVYSQDWHPASTPHFEKDGGIWPVHCVGDSWGAELHPDLLVVGPSVKKGVHGEDGYSAFSMKDPQTGETTSTELEAMLRERGITKTVVVGLATDYCVSATAIDAAHLKFDTEVLQDAIASVDLAEGDGDKAKAAMAAAGCVLGYCFGTLPY